MAWLKKYCFWEALTLRCKAQNHTFNLPTSVQVPTWGQMLYWVTAEGEMDQVHLYGDAVIH